MGTIAAGGGTPGEARSFRSAPSSDASPIVLDHGVGANLVWEQQADQLFTVQTYRDEPRRSDVVRVRQYNTEKIFNANCGTLIETQYA